MSASPAPRPERRALRLIANEKTVPRLHLVGTLVVVFFSWQNLVEQKASLQRVEAVLQQQQRQRLSAEMDSALSYIEFVRSRTHDVLRRSLVNQVDNALQVAEAIYRRESPLRPAAEVRQLIIEALREVRFYDGRGYFFIDDMEGRFILLPTAPQLEGKLLPDNRDDTGHPIMK